jgi:nucleoside-diphosphate-sugar epimerase
VEEIFQQPDRIDSRATPAMAGRLPDSLENEEQLDELLTRPTDPLIEFIRRVSSPLVILGAGGKMGPTLAVLAKRAAEAAGHPLDVVAVSRFSDGKIRQWLEKHEVKTQVCDLLDKDSIVALPETHNLLYLVGLKFGTAKNPALTWAVNTVVPTRVAERYPRARMVALSTGNVYPLANCTHGGSLETDMLTPIGEYANAAIARERIFEFHSRRTGTCVTLLRLLYAVELRYGVLVDIARKVWAREPIVLTNGWFNCIWQGDANEMTIRALAMADSPPSVWNLCRPEVLSVRSVATRLGDLMNRDPLFTGSEAETALLANPSGICGQLGLPSVQVDTMLQWIARWVMQQQRNFGKPTHFEVRDGSY